MPINYLSRYQSKINFLLISLALLLRLINDTFLSIAYEGVLSLIQVCTYIIFCYLIFINRRSLARFHIDRITLIVFILFRILLYTSGHTAFFLVLELIVYIISSLLLLYLLKQDRGFELPKISLSHFVFCISGALLGIGIGILQAWLHQSLKPIHLGNFSGQFITYFFYSLSVPVIMEEPLFRGFLWGYLREKGFQETPIWIIQACIFSLIHVTKWHSLPLLLEAFAFGLIIGSIVRFTRSLAPAMTFHAAVNGIIFAFLFASP